MSTSSTQIDRQLGAVAWQAPASLTFDEWRAVGKRLGIIGRASQWWIGDWINFGAAHYSDRYQEAVEITGYDIGTLMNMAWVAGAVEPSRRHEVLSWSHHYEVAGLTAAEQDDWLAQAAEHGWSQKTLRGALKRARYGTPPPRPSPVSEEAAPESAPVPPPPKEASAETGRTEVTMRLAYPAAGLELQRKLDEVRRCVQDLGFEVLHLA